MKSLTIKIEEKAEAVKFDPKEFGMGTWKCEDTECGQLNQRKWTSMKESCVCKNCNKLSKIAGPFWFSLSPAVRDQLKLKYAQTEDNSITEVNQHG